MAKEIGCIIIIVREIQSVWEACESEIPLEDGLKEKSHLKVDIRNIHTLVRIYVLNSANHILCLFVEN